MTTMQYDEAAARAARVRDIARFDAQMAARQPSPWDNADPLGIDAPDDSTDWHTLPKGWYALPVCDWVIFGDMVSPDDSDPEPVAPLMGFLLAARKVPRRHRDGRVTGRDSLTPVRLIAAPEAVAPIGNTDTTPYQRLREEAEAAYHDADHPDCPFPPGHVRDDGMYYREPGYCRWHYDTRPSRQWGFPATREGAERWRNRIAFVILGDRETHGDRLQALYGQLTGKCGKCGRLLTDPGSREAGIGPDCRQKAS